MSCGAAALAAASSLTIASALSGWVGAGSTAGSSGSQLTIHGTTLGIENATSVPALPGSDLLETQPEAPGLPGLNGKYASVAEVVGGDSVRLSAGGSQATVNHSVDTAPRSLPSTVRSLHDLAASQVSSTVHGLTPIESVQPRPDLVTGPALSLANAVVSDAPSIVANLAPIPSSSAAPLPSLP